MVALGPPVGVASRDAVVPVGNYTLLGNYSSPYANQASPSPGQQLDSVFVCDTDNNASASGVTRTNTPGALHADAELVTEVPPRTLHSLRDHATCGPPRRIFHRADPTLEWINSHPYHDCGALGQGAFGSVRKVKLLTPLGYTVQHDARGIPVFKDGDGDMLLRKMTEQEWEHNVGGKGLRGLQSWGKEGGDDAAGVVATQLNFSGITCAAKDVTARSDAEFQRCLEEIKLMATLGDSERVVRVYDWQTVWSVGAVKIRRVIIVMELGEMDFAQYLKSRSLSDDESADDGGSAAQKKDGAAQEDSRQSESVFKMSSSRQEASQGIDPPNRRPMDATEIFGWWRQMVFGLHQVHSHDIMHCDIKPSNFIMVRSPAPRRSGSRDHENYTLKLCDFGVSRQLGDSETHISLVNAFGTLLYMSPEMLHSIAPDSIIRVTKSVDVWGLGVILHQMLHCGATPYGHFAQYGKFRLMVAIPDEKAARMQVLCGRLLDEERHHQTKTRQRQHQTVSGVASDAFLRQTRHDILLGLQLVCLGREPQRRPTSADLLCLTETAEQFFRCGDSWGSGSSQDQEGVSQAGEVVAPISSACGEQDEKAVVGVVTSTAALAADVPCAETNHPSSSSTPSHPVAQDALALKVGDLPETRSQCLDQTSMALRVLIGRAVAARTAMRMTMSSTEATLTSNGGRGRTLSTVRSLLAAQHTSPSQPSLKPDQDEFGEDERNTSTSCGVKQVLLGIGGALLAAIAVLCIGTLWVSVSLRDKSDEDSFVPPGGHSEGWDAPTSPPAADATRPETEVLSPSSPR